VEVVYTVPAERELGNAQWLRDFKEGDDIVVDYTEKDGVRVAIVVVKEERFVDLNGAQQLCRAVLPGCRERTEWDGSVPTGGCGAA
jgi:hypothetical protein